MKTAFAGKWKILEMEQWDQDYVDEEMPAHITFEKSGVGDFHFGYVDAGLDWRYAPDVDRVDFTFEGNDEMDPVSGRGWAKIEGRQMIGYIIFHLGDASGFKGKKTKS